MTNQPKMLKFLRSFIKKKCFNPLAGILPEPLAKRFASLLDELMAERHSKRTKTQDCHKIMLQNK